MPYTLHLMNSWLGNEIIYRIIFKNQNIILMIKRQFYVFELVAARTTLSGYLQLVGSAEFCPGFSPTRRMS